MSAISSALGGEQLEGFGEVWGRSRLAGRLYFVCASLAGTATPLVGRGRPGLPNVAK